MVQGSVKPPTEVMSEKDTMEALTDGAKKAAFAARELAEVCHSTEWSNIVETLNALRDGARQLANMKAMSRLETLMAAQIKTAPYRPH